MDSPATPSGELLAAVDLGSNSFRLEVAQFQHGRYRRVEYLKEVVRLGAGLDADEQLTEAAAQRGLDCLGRFARRLLELAPAQVRAVATQTLREARNRDAFLQRAQTALGQAIEVISGREEARLIFAGVAYLQPSDQRRLVIDIGGRSTEMVLGRARRPEAAESFQVGSVSLSMRWFPDGVLTAKAFRGAQTAAGAELEEALHPFSRERWDEALGSSGTVSAVSQLLAASEVTDGRITAAGLRWMVEQCVAAGHVDRIALPGLREDRRAVLPGGLAILYTLATHFSIDELIPAKGALRQGVIVDLQQRRDALSQADGRDLRDATVERMQRRFQADVTQAERVRSVALALFRGARPNADIDAVRELGWACQLHEIGLTVSHHDHHRHSAYLVGHADAPGFSQNQQRRIADLLLAQRGGLRKVQALLDHEPLAWQVLALRLALIACHARNDVEPGALTLRATERSAVLECAGDWAAGHPRTMHLLHEEAQAWSRLGSLELRVPQAL